MARLLDDVYLGDYADAITGRKRRADDRERSLTLSRQPLKDWAAGHHYFGLHRTGSGWVFREWAPNAERIWLVGDFSGWRTDGEFELEKLPGGVWEIMPFVR